MKRRALITGITGMDGSHLADLLLGMDYEVHGLVRRCSRPITQRIAHLDGQVILHEGDMLDQSSLATAVTKSNPHEVYNLAAQSFVGTSWTQPLLTAEITGLGTLRLLEVVRHLTPKARFYQASSSEMYGNATTDLQDEHTAFKPRSPYGVAKVFAHQIAINYRESYGMHVSCGILFNHESERRGLEFVTRKISRQVAEIVHGQREQLTLGNTCASRDWGYAPDYVYGMWLMLQNHPSDFVLATGTTHTVHQFAQEALKAADLTDLPILFDADSLRPAELHTLCGDPTKAYQVLDWNPQIAFHELVRRMVSYDIAEVGLGLAA